MSEVTVSDLAKQVRISTDKLLVQLKDAGINAADENAIISTEEKAKLLNYLKSLHGKPATKPKIALKKKTTLSTNKDNVSIEVKSKNQPASTAPKAKAPPRVSASEMAKKMAEERRLHQGDAMREAEQKARLEQEEEKRLRIEKETKARKDKQEKEALEKLAIETDAKEKAKLTAERKKRLEKEAEENAKVELEKHVQREKEAVKVKEVDELERKKAEEEVAKQEKVEQLGASKFRENRKEIKKIQKKQTEKISINNKHKFEKPTAQIVTEVTIPETITVGELAAKMNKKASELIMVLMKMGTMMTINHIMDQDTAALLLEEMGHKYSFINENEDEEALLESAESQLSEVKPRPPIVTIMGHVDHGKTSLLDFIRRTHVTAGEAGGITQHIGSYHVETENGIVTFLDTPGHAAFTAMRARGAKVTDIVVVVVAADDGVMPQTIEAITHAKAAKAPIIIAVNKMDKPDADPEKIKSELTQHEIVSEEWGGEVMFAEISAKTGMGVDNLLEKILLQAEVLELTAAYRGPATGIVIESKIDKGRGAVASVIIQQGSLKKGDFVLSGQEYGRVRAMSDENGKLILEAGPSIPVEILGLSGAPEAGEELICVENERTAKDLANRRQAKAKEVRIARQQKLKLENLFSNVGDNKLEEVNILVKTDVQGSSEALRDALLKLSTDEVAVRVINSSVGGITESDVNLAIASKAMIIGFNVRAESGAKKLVETESVDLRYYSVIYDAIEDVRQAMIGKLAPEFREDIVGIAEVKEVFKAPKIGLIAGSIIVDGYVKRDNPIRVLRNNVVIFEGELESLRRFKDDVNEVRAGTECGIGVKNYNDVRIGDHIECYERRQVTREL